MLQFNRLVSGGIITNYDCSSKCKHCVYASSPQWPKDYMTSELAEEVFRFLVGSGCDTVHIGGGEPLLHPDSIFPILKAARKSGVQIEYIETNASWYKDFDKAGDLLRKLQQHGVYTLLISMDPFHNEYIPFCKVKGLMRACRQNGMAVFPWLMEFREDLDAIGDAETHSLEEYERFFGTGYQLQLLKRYHLNLKGRALKTYKSYLNAISVQQILQSSAPCKELSGVHHFHIDLYGNFIPQSCPGLSVHFRDLNGSIEAKKYPVINELATTGIRGLYNLAVNCYGFVPEEKYTGKCDLCHDIRKYLVIDMGIDSPELQPRGHYMFI